MTLDICVSQSTVWCDYRKEGIHLFDMERVQCLNISDCLQRLDFGPEISGPVVMLVPPNPIRKFKCTP